MTIGLCVLKGIYNCKGEENDDGFLPVSFSSTIIYVPVSFSSAGFQVINTQHCYAAVHTNLYNWQLVVLISYHLHKKMVQISTDLRYNLTTFPYCRVHYNRSSEVSLKSFSN